MRKVAEIEKEIEKLREQRAERAEVLAATQAEREKVRARRDEAKGMFELNLSMGKDLGRSEKALKEAELELWTGDRKVGGTETAIQKLDEVITAAEAELRKVREAAYVAESEKVLRELRGLQANLLGPLRRAYILVEALQRNQGNRTERVPVHNRRVRYTDPVLIAQKIPHVLHTRQVKVGGPDSPLVPVETFAPDPKATEVLEWLSYDASERLVREGRAVIVNEGTPKYETRHVADPLPEIFNDLVALQLGRLVLRDAVPGITELVATIGPDLTTQAIGPTVTRKEREAYLGEVEK